MRNEQPVRRRKTDTERQRNTVPDKKYAEIPETGLLRQRNKSRNRKEEHRPLRQPPGKEK